ncbi:hypothetical protein Hhel01_00290 [Haloferula helveola]
MLGKNINPAVPALLAVLMCLLAASCKREVTTVPANPLTTEAYVWQAPGRPEVQEAVGRAEGAIGRLQFRAAELRWRENRFEVEEVIRQRLPVPGCGLVVRVGQSAAALDWSAAQCEDLEEVVASLAALGPSEIQLDYDCPQRRLGVYRRLLARVRKAAEGVPVVPTALPSWLAEKEFAELARESPGYVVQVHSLTLPRTPDDPVVLLDPDLARGAVAKAAAIGVPFRVAMPTYGCEVWFDRNGKVIDVISEDLPPEGVTPAKRSYAYVDPAIGAKLVAEWMQSPPVNLTGIIWYRLPISTDRRNWPWQTLEKVSRGEVPTADVRVERKVNGRAGDVTILNQGSAPVRLPERVIARGAIVAADAVGGYRLEKGGRETVFRFGGAEWSWIEPGERVIVGWITSRDKDASITLEIE